MTKTTREALATEGATEATELYCPFCGKQTVRVEAGEGDYYLGPTFVCLSCEEEFCLK